jgi:hypothetical protein
MKHCPFLESQTKLIKIFKPKKNLKSIGKANQKNLRFLGFYCLLSVKYFIIGQYHRSFFLEWDSLI